MAAKLRVDSQLAEPFSRPLDGVFMESAGYRHVAIERGRFVDIPTTQNGKNELVRRPDVGSRSDFARNARIILQYPVRR
jgi:hypothetical protein